MKIEKKQEAEISFFAAECMEFVDQGVLWEGMNLSEAVKAYKRICKRGTMRGPGIGFILHDPKIPNYSDIHWPLYQGRQIAANEIQLIPAYLEHPLVKAAVQEMQNYLPRLAENGKPGRKRNALEMGVR